MGAVAKTFDRIIPNEIKPIVPIAASMFGAPFLSAVLPGAAATGIMGALRAGAIGAGTNVLSQAAMGQKVDPRSAIASGLFSGFGTGLRDIKGTSKLAQAGKRFGEILSPATYSTTAGFALTGTGEGLSAITQPATLAATTGGTLSAIDAAEKANEEYERMMQEQGMTEAADTQSRRDYIQRYMNLAGFDQDEIDDALSRYGYAKGGRAGFAEGGGSLYDKASDMNRLALEIKLIDLGYGGFGGKDLEGMSDEEIIQLYKEATSKAKGGLMGTRVGYEMGGMSDLGKLFSKITGKKPTEESLMDLKSRYAKEIENQMINELNDDYPAMETLIQIRNQANKQADIALNDYMKSLGMEPFNPPEDSMSDKLINQIMEPRKEGRVMEANGGRIKYAEGGSDTEKRNIISSLMFKLANGDISETEVRNILSEMMFDSAKGKKNGGRIKKSIGGLAFAYSDYLRQADELGLSGDPMSFEDFTDTWLELQSDLGNSKKYKKGGRIKYAGGGYTPIDYYDELNYKDYLEKLEEGLVPIDETTGKPMSYEDYEQDRAEGMMAKGGRAGYAGGGSSTEQQKRENYFDLKRDEFMSLSEYLVSPMSDADLRKGKAEGGMMNLAVGGMPAEMDLRPGGFVPIGKKEKADDVPARLSKNEFVFTADAVRAAGGGSVNKGAQRMYDLMHSLEAKV